MLSKVLSGRDTEKAEPIVFTPVAHGSVDRRRNQLPPRDAPQEEENKALTEKIRRLQAEAAASRTEAFEAGLKQGLDQARLDIAPIL